MSKATIGHTVGTYVEKEGLIPPAVGRIHVSKSLTRLDQLNVRERLKRKISIIENTMDPSE